MNYTAILIYAAYHLPVDPYFSPLHDLPRPAALGLLGTHLHLVLNATVSPRETERMVKQYGRTFRIVGMGVLTTLGSISHILNRPTIYEKPWQSRRLITRLIGEGLLASEGQSHRRQRKVSNPAFSPHNLRDRWLDLMTDRTKGIKISDVCGRTAFDVIGLAGFDYAFHSIYDELNETCSRWLSQGQDWKTVAGIYFPLIHTLWPDEKSRIVSKSQEIIYRIGRQLVQEKEKQLLDDDETRCNKDLLSLLLKSNLSTNIPPDQRISDDGILNQISAFLFADSDTSSLTMTWTLYLPGIKKSKPGSEERCAAYAPTLDALQLLDCVLRESLRLIPALHSSLRVGTQDDEIPLSEPIMKDGTVRHVPEEGLNLDRGAWGKTGWEFGPDRWLNLPETAKQQPGLYSNLLTFSASPRSCIGMRFAIIEMKIILYILVLSFVFSGAENITKMNVVLTATFRSQCPMNVRPV
ncbi:cytochrome P450 [Gautieria morchelliformis]|nr:cytochrome P450 [Gautieria morchelliformis]